MNQPAMLPGLLDGGMVHWTCPHPACTNSGTTTIPLPQTPWCTHGGRGTPARMIGTRLTEITGDAD